MIGPRLRYSARDELANLDLRYSTARVITGLIPPLVGVRLRTGLLRAAGISIGQGTTIGGTLHVHGSRGAARRVRIGSFCWINTSCTLDATASITIGDHVAIGQEVLIITNTHELSSPHERAGTLRSHPVLIGDGVWIGARATILPGVTIGAGAVVAAGAVVNKDVAPNTMVAGVPARSVKSLDDAS